MKKALTHLILIFIVPSVLFLSLESLARIYFNPKLNMFVGLFVYDSVKVYTLRKNAISTLSGKEVRTNSYGYRSREITKIKPNNTKRIVVVGDSVSFGHGVGDNETYSSFLEQQAFKEDVKLEVINTAVPGNSPFQEIEDLKRALQFSPDLVILQFTLNDVVEPQWLFQRFGGLSGSQYGVKHIPYYDYILTEHCALYNVLKQTFLMLRFGANATEGISDKAASKLLYSVEELIQTPEAYHIKKAWDECLNIEQSMVELLRELDIPIILLVSPYEFQFYEPMEKAEPQRRLAEFATKNQIKYVDILDILHNAYKSEVVPLGNDSSSLKIFWDRYFLDYNHNNVEGHRFTANILWPMIVNALYKN